MEGVGTKPAIKRVITGTTIDKVTAGSAGQLVITGTTMQGIVARSGVYCIVAVTTVDEVMLFIQTFIETSYLMGSARQDANTMNNIDPNRCFDSGPQSPNY